MRLHIFSDIHLEFHRDKVAFLKKLHDAVEDVDVMVIPGDLDYALSVKGDLSWLCGNCDTPVIFVPGNHCYYTSSVEKGEAALRDAHEPDGDIFVLNDGVAMIGEQRFVGTPLWFGHINNAFLRAQLNDYHQIEGFEPWVYQRNMESVIFLAENVHKDDVVVTHHLPAEECISARFKGDPFNHFFMHDMRELILERKPKLWIHGHTHDSVDVMVGETRIVCNPFGYWKREENPNFDPGFVVEL